MSIANLLYQNKSIRKTINQIDDLIKLNESYKFLF